MTFDAAGATVAIASTFHDQPSAYRLRMPYFKELTTFSSDAKTARKDGDCIILSPDATRVHIAWRDRPGAHLHTVERLLTAYRSAGRLQGTDAQGFPIIVAGKPFLLDGEKSDAPQPLGFATVRAAFQHEYDRLAATSSEHLITVTAPPMLSADERRSGFIAQYGEPLSNPAKGCTVQASSNEPGYGPEKAVDGDLSLESSWRATPYPQWIKLDLAKPLTLKAIQVWPYWGGGRYYRYNVETSADGTSWEQVGDKLTNTEPATRDGDRFDFTQRAVRFIRVTVRFNSLNTGVHIVEITPVEAK